MKKMLSSGKGIALIVLSMVLIATIAVSLAFWSEGILGAGTNDTLTVNIGAGDDVVTELDVTPGLVTGGALIPAHRTPKPATNQVVAYVFDVPVYWQGTGDSAVDASGVPGMLAVSVNYIRITGQGATDFKEHDGEAAGVKLFNVAFNGAGLNNSEYAITGNNVTPVTVRVTVTMSEPTQLQYGMIKNGSITVQLAFAVTVNS